MKKKLLSYLLVAFTGFTAAAQTEKIVDLGAGYANTVWLNLATEESTIELQNQWDMAFSTGSTDATIRINHSKGVRVFQHPNPSASSLQTMDITDAESSWNELFNNETDWMIGALNSSANTESLFDFGWGAYSIITHNIQGNQLYAIKLSDETWKRFRVQNLVGGVYNLIFADANGTNEQTVAIAKSDFTNKNFGYYNITDNQTLDLEPESDSWDLFFGQYFTSDLSVPYNVTGVLSNIGVEVARIESENPSAEFLPEASLFTSDANGVGYNWKNFNMSTFSWELSENLVFFVKDLNQQYWKIIFTAFAGQSTGEIAFTKELLGTVNINEFSVSKSFTNLYPNPAQNQVNLVVDNQTNSNTVVQIFSIEGKLVYEQNLGLGFIQKQIAISNLNQGIYNVRILIGNEVQNLKLIKN